MFEISPSATLHRFSYLAASSLCPTKSAAKNAVDIRYLLEHHQCTIELCPIDDAFIRYDPSLAGNTFYAALSGVLLIAQAVLGIRYKTWSFMFGLCAGLVLEVVGYVGRILMHNDPFADNNFLM